MIQRMVAALLLLAGCVVPAGAQKPPPSGEVLVVHPEAKAAIDALKSPYCPGMMLEVCPSPGGARLRDSIQLMATEGYAADSIVEVILARYGEEWRALPKRSGTGGWAWYLPPVALLAGVGMVASVLIGRRRRASPAEDWTDPSAEEEALLRKELTRLEEEEEPVF